MKKAVVVGGSNGMGLAISMELLARGYYVEIVDVSAPDENELGRGCEAYNYSYTNLLYFDEDLFNRLSIDEEIEVLIITAGIGRIADFQYHHIAEIEKTFTIDTVSTLKILRIFYERILSLKSFYTGVMGSIAGWMSSPAASVYSAAKAGVVRFIESVNIELEVSGSPNRILDVSPASFKGSRFYGGKNNLSLISGLASEIVSRVFERETRFIPQYEEVFKEVLNRYNRDSREYGIHSYNYKKRSGRIDNNQRVKVGYLNLSFEIFDISTLKALKEAKNQCDYLIIGVKNNESIDSGHGQGAFEEKKELLEGCRYVDRVIDGSIAENDVWEKWHFNRLFSEQYDMENGHYLKCEEYNNIYL